MRQKQASLVITALLLGAMGFATSSVAQMSASERFSGLYTREWQWRSAQFELDQDSENHTIAKHLPDVGLKAQRLRLDYWRGVEAELKAIDISALSEQDKVSYAVYLGQIEALIDAQTFREFEKPLNSDSTFWSDLTSVARDRFKTEADYRNYLSLLSEMPRYFLQQTQNMRSGLKRGFTPPRVTLTGRESGLLAIINAKTIEENIYYLPFKDMPATIPAEIQVELRANARKLIVEAVIPAHRSVLDFFVKDYVPHSTQSLAASKLPNGEAYYLAQIKAYTTLDLTPEAIHQTGLEQVALIHDEMLGVIKTVDFKGSFAEFLQFLRSDPQFYAKTPQELLNRAAWIAKDFDAKAKDYFGHLPRSRFGIIPVPDDIAPFYTSGRGGPGVYLVNTYNLPSRALYSLPALTLHESAPGHAFQMPLAAENKSLPEFRQKSYISAYGEGWALYSERLGDEMGIYKTPYERFGMLSYQMWRAARLVVDTGIHHKGWTREQAQGFLRDNTALSEHEITTEVDRYIAWPGQALSYYLGEMTIITARKKAESALGAKFNIRAFHDAVLELGGVPLPVVVTRIDRFIAEGGKGPYPDEE